MAKETESDDDGGDELTSSPHQLVSSFVQRRMPSKRADGSSVPWAEELVERLLQDLDALDLPCNPIDELIAKLGGPSKVAELTGRSHRVEQQANGSSAYVRRKASGVIGSKRLNVHEQQLFQTGQKRVAIITEAASAGISLHDDTRLGLQRQRVMITLELPWSAEKAQQQFGRVHRSNQFSRPSFRLMITNLAGEVRFVSTIARRLLLLGAMTKGDRRSSEVLSSLESFDVHNRAGCIALEALCECLKTRRFRNSAVPSFLGTSWPTWAAFAEEASVKLKSFGFTLGYMERRHAGQSALQDAAAVSRFLNRVLMLEVAMQRTLIDAFFELQKQALASVQIPGGLEESAEQLHLQQGWRRVRSISVSKREDLPDGGSGAGNQVAYLRIDAGLSWSEALGLWQTAKDDPDSGFYLYSKKDEILVCLVLPQDSVASLSPSSETGPRSFYVLEPETGVAVPKEKEALQLSLPRCKPCGECLNEAETLWKKRLQLSEESSSRISEKLLLTGDALSTWHMVASAFSDGFRSMPVARAVTDRDEDLRGILLKPQSLPEVKYVLTALSQAAVPCTPEPEGVEQERADKLRAEIHDHLRRNSEAPWSSWCDAHSCLVRLGKANNSPRDMRGVQQAMQILEGFGTIKVNRRKGKTTLELVEDGNFKVMQGSGRGIQMMADFRAISELATSKDEPAQRGGPAKKARRMEASDASF